MPHYPEPEPVVPHYPEPEPVVPHYSEPESESEPEPLYVPEPEPVVPHVPHYPEPESEEVCGCEEQEDKIFELEWEKAFLREKVKTLMG